MFVIPACLVFIDYLEGQAYESLTLLKKLNPAQQFLFTLVRDGDQYTLYDETHESTRNYRLIPSQGELPVIVDLDTDTPVEVTSFDNNEYELTDEETGRKLFLRKVAADLYELVEEEDYLLSLQ